MIVAALRAKEDEMPEKRVHLMFCTCIDCAINKAVEHGVSDAKCGREWVCQCGSCKRTRENPEWMAHVAFARLEYLEAKLARVRAVKER